MDGRKDELARAKAETEENLKSTKEQNDRFWQGFLEKRKTHRVTHLVVVAVCTHHCLDQTRHRQHFRAWQILSTRSIEI